MDRLDKQIKDMEAHLAALRGNGHGEPHGLLQQSFVELGISLKELRVAEEELRVQNEELMHAHEALETERQRYAGLFNFAPDAYLVTDTAGVVQEANAAAAALLGISPRFLLRKPLITFVHEDERPDFRSLLSRLSEGANVREWEVCLKRRRASDITAALTVAPAHGSDGEITGLRWLVRDVSERKQTEQSHYRLIVEEVKDFAIFMLDARNRVVHWNCGAETIMGFTEREAMGQPGSFIFTPEDRERGEPEKEAETAIREGRAEDERWHLKKDGSRFFASGVLTALKDAHGNLRGFVKVLRDITERKQAEINLQKKYEREHRIAETLQRSFLVELAEDAFPGLFTASFYAAAFAESEVGGDFFDAFALGEGRVALVVGDASGKGLEAAARTSEVKDVLRAFLRSFRGLAVARILARLNDFLCDAQRLDAREQEGFVALALVVIDTNSGEAIFGSAGAEPPLVLRARGKRVEEIPTGGLPLGAFPNQSYESTTVRLSEGDTIILATDGITEARRGSSFLGYDGMVEVAQQASGSSVHALGQAILNAARDFAGGSLHDDACLIVARRR